MTQEMRICVADTGFMNGILRATESPHTLPCNYIETLSPLCNDSAFSVADQPPAELDFEEWKKWGHTWKTRSCLFAEASCGTQKLCIKMAINLEKEQYKDDPEDCLEPSNVAVAQCLLNEWSFYNDRLRDLQGTLVPRHYGLWTCHSSWGGVVLFSIFEWAGVSAYRLLRQDWKDRDTMDYRLECVSAIRDLHLSGILHGQLVGFNGIRHILFDPDTKKARLIDFSHAKVGHKCERSTFPTARGDYCDPGCCMEIGWVCRNLNIWSPYHFAFGPADEEVACGPDVAPTSGQHAPHSPHIAASG
ncbi:hypothetical protein PC9H_010366 [Pleurotus ostreatus]|uniref:Protein kinase domain-containing protein n=1 Tax=Pleurotus ostreatus TaxID=5322 RepID=A0A8H6ZJQ4_PLEOS|nr:uncharacterized protein PC9H_010366 [Pleurotus ostreatus]KAF7422210.1 hypothetical protein PC9H_010366 [Pleurotus ostreatus]KAJ8692001.1 hypothetical protein PTI98_011517 [Pleurotus ostreatus]